MSRILNVATVKPPYSYTTEEIMESADRHWLSQVDPSVRNAALKIFRGADIQSRSSAVPIETVFSPLSFEEKNNIYMKEAVALGEKAVTKALKDSGFKAKDIDIIISTSCTGFMIPSLDAYIVNSLGFRRDVVRLPVTEMGCAGGTSALIYADNFLKAHPEKKLLIISVEIPSITFQMNDLSMENLVSTAIFADGAAAVVMDGQEGPGAHIVDTEMYHFPNTTDLMGYHLQNSGLKIVLDREVPDTINEHFNNLFYPLLARHELNEEDIHHYMFHPGGKKIINRVEDFIGRFGKDISDSKNVLKERGNLSSATILHILEKKLEQNPKNDELGYMLAFGPGFMAQSLLLKWVV